MTKKILIVDDDKNISQILYTALNAKGYLTSVAKNGEEALKQFNSETPNLVLLDVLLPKINGWEVCRKIKDTEQGLRTTVIIMTALYRTMKHRSDSINKYGANDFVEKPFQLHELLQKITTCIGEPDGHEPEPVAEAIMPFPADPEPETPSVAPTEEKTAAPEQQSPSVQSGKTEGNVLHKSGKKLQLQGGLKDISFPHLLHCLYAIKESGLLELKNNETRKRIALKEGYPVSIESNLEDEYFGNFLVRLGKITPSECEDSRKLMLSNKRLQGMTLVEMGLLTPHELSKYLKMQCRDKLFEIFGWEDGAYEFTLDPEVTGDITTFEMSPATLIFEGIKKRYTLERLRKELDVHHMKYVVSGKNLYYRFQDLELSAEEQKIRELIEGNRMVGEVLSLSSMDIVKTYQLLYTLYVTEIIDISASPATEEDAAVSKETQETKETQAPKPQKEARPNPKPTRTQAPPKESMSEEDSNLRKTIMETYQSMQAKNYFEILGLTQEASDADIKAAYHRLAKEYHPDRFFGKVSGDIKGKVEEVFRKISDAYNILSDPDQKDHYLSSLGEKVKRQRVDKVAEEVKVILYAEKSFQRGLEFIGMRNFPKAVEQIAEAYRARPQEADYLAHLGWATFNLPMREHDGSKRDKDLAEEEWEEHRFKGREMVDRSTKMNPRNDRAYVFLGHIYRQIGQKEYAFRQYEKALIVNPNCVDALRELRLMKMKTRTKQQKKGLLKKLIDKLNQPIGGS